MAPSKVSLHPHLPPLYSLLPPHTPLSSNHHYVVVYQVSRSFFVCFFIISSLFSLSPQLLSSDSCSLYLWVCIKVSTLFVSLFCSLASTARWNHMLFVFWISVCNWRHSKSNRFWKCHVVNILPGDIILKSAMLFHLSFSRLVRGKKPAVTFSVAMFNSQVPSWEVLNKC